MKKTISLILAAVLLTAVVAWAQPYYKPRIISAEKLKALMDQGKELVLVDARSAKEYAMGYIPGAINVPNEKFIFIVGFLPIDRNALVITYCRGYG